MTPTEACGRIIRIPSLVDRAQSKLDRNQKMMMRGLAALFVGMKRTLRARARIVCRPLRKLLLDYFRCAVRAECGTRVHSE